MDVRLGVQPGRVVTGKRVTMRAVADWAFLGCSHAMLGTHVTFSRIDT
jgi:hypothetical protein